MNRRYLTSSLLVAALLCFMASNNALAQSKRADGLYVRGRVGASSYAGDRDGNPDNSVSTFFEQQIGFPSLGLELGYAWNLGGPRLGLALTYIGGKYERISRPYNACPGVSGIDRPCPSDESSQWRHTGGLAFQLGFLPSYVLNPYIRLGAHATYGKVLSQFNAENPDEDISDFELAFGPMAGIGVDIAVSKHVGIFLEATGMGLIPDDNSDLTCGNEECDFDIIGAYGGGLRVTFDSPFTPVQIFALDGPQSLTAGEEGTFTATVNSEDATKPLSYQWEFGDGATGTGLLATHTYSEAGTYTVTFTASNSGSTASESMTVEVVPAPVPASIISVDAFPQPATEGEEVSFSSEVEGTEPVECEWDFGDGATSTDCEASHVYEEAGEYTATLTATNEYGEDTRTVTVEVEPALPAICMQVTELNSVYFDPNSSTLTEEGMAALDENIEIVAQCPNLDVRIEGYAAPGERNPEELSTARAEAVAQYYTDNGIEDDRLTTEGMGVVGGQTSKKGAGSQFRRVDSIPVNAGVDGGMDMEDDMDMQDDMDMEDDMDMPQDTMEVPQDTMEVPQDTMDVNNM